MTAAGAPESDTPMQLAGDGGPPESMYGVQKWQLYNLKDFFELNGTTRSKRTRASMSVEHENESVVSQRVPCGIMPYTSQPSPWLKTDTENDYVYSTHYGHCGKRKCCCWLSTRRGGGKAHWSISELEKHMRWCENEKLLKAKDESDGKAKDESDHENESDENEDANFAKHEDDTPQTYGRRSNDAAA